MADQAQAVRTPLTRRQQEVAALLARGMSNGEIAAALKVSPLTVQTHVSAIGIAWGIKTREELCRVAAGQAEGQCSSCVWTAEARSLGRLLGEAVGLVGEISAQLRSSAIGGRPSRAN